MAPTRIRSDQHLFAVSFACFAAAGIAGTAETVGPTIAATALAIAGVYALARYARAVSRRTLAVVAVGCWTAFLGVATLHAIGPASVGAIVPAPGGVVVVLIDGATWATLLSASGTTAFLAFREYGSQAGSDTLEEQVLDGDRPSEY